MHRKGADRSEREASRDEQQAFAQDELENAGGAAAQRDSDADLLRPLRHQIRQDAIDADRREKQRHGAEPERQQHRRSPRHQRLVRPLRHRLNGIDRQLGI